MRKIYTPANTDFVMWQKNGKNPEALKSIMKKEGYSTPLKCQMEYIKEFWRNEEQGLATFYGMT